MFLEIKDLHINLGEFFLRGVSFEVEKGDYLSIIGPTGAGKTILLESIIGFWTPDNGRIIVDGKDLTDEWPEKRRIGIVYQDYALFPHFTVFQNIAYGLKKIEKTGIEEKTRAIATSLHIAHLLHRKPGTLSGGEQQRVALARALVVNPRLLLMDEPFSALDQQTRKQARHILKTALKERGTTVIHITHDLDDAWALANKIAVMKDGKLIQFGTLKDVFQQPATPFIAEFVGANFFDGHVIHSSNGSSIVDVNGTRLTCRGAAPAGQKVKVAIRPENVMVVKTPPLQNAAANILKTTLTEITSEGNSCLLHLKSREIFIKVLVTPSALEMNSLQTGDSLYALIGRDTARIALGS